MVQLQIRIAMSDGKLIITSETLVDELVEEQELQVSGALEKIFLQSSKKAAQISGMDLTVLQDTRNLTTHAPAGTVAGSKTSKEDENDRPEARIPGCTCYAHQWGWHADTCPLYDESLLP